MNRRGFSLKKVRKTIPQKKIPQTDAIFENVRAAHLCAEKDPSILRVSIDCKARVKIGSFSRGGSIYPLYHSKYNPVERCWSALERHWNGALLTTIETSLKWVNPSTAWRANDLYQWMPLSPPSSCPIAYPN